MARTRGGTPARRDGLLARIARYCRRWPADRSRARPIATSTARFTALLAGLAVGWAALVPPGPPGGQGALSRRTTASAAARSIPVTLRAARSAHRPSTSSSPSLLLVSAPWVTEPGQADELQVAVQAPSSDASLRVLVYGRFHTRSGLAAALAGTIGQPLLWASTPLSLSQLPSAGLGRLAIRLVLATPSHPDPSVPPGSLGPVPLDCPGGPGSCGGVYPVVVQLTSGRRTSSLVTTLVYTYPRTSPAAVLSPLRVALVVPLAAPLVRALPSPATQATLAALARASAQSRLPLTLAPEPALLTDLAAWSSADRRALDAALRAPDRQVVAEPLAPVDLPALVRAGLQPLAETALAQSCSALAGLPLVPLTAFLQGPQDPETIAAVRQACGGIRNLVLPASDLAGRPCTLGCAAPVALQGLRGGPLLAAQVDPQSSTELTAFPHDPVLAAHWVVADLTLAAYEEPSARQPRGLVVAPGPGTLSASELSGLLTGLSLDPALDPVTLSTYFSQVPAGADGQPAERPLATPPGGRALAVGDALRSAARQLTGLADALAGSTAGRLLADRLETQLVLAASSDLTALARHHALEALSAALEDEVDRIHVPDTTIRLTSSQALRIPVTLTNQTGVPLAGTLRIQSDQLLFTPLDGCRGTDPVPGGFTGVACPVTLSRAADAVYVSVRARSAGAFRVRATLLAPNGAALVSGRLEVQSLSATWEALVLSGAALLVLLAWWARTLLRPRGRHARRRTPQSSLSARGLERTGA
ncbi:hypothetical protein ACFFRE_00340 [Aciditerrimonas ferrireducens]|uniref:Glycoprotein n=1 Tax=Aciditerrimonas ferrireducens TaxID=667306 RepID=A0ABV6BYS6_9ACTN